LVYWQFFLLYLLVVSARVQRLQLSYHRYCVLQTESNLKKQQRNKKDFGIFKTITQLQIEIIIRAAGLDPERFAGRSATIISGKTILKCSLKDSLSLSSYFMRPTDRKHFALNGSLCSDTPFASYVSNSFQLSLSVILLPYAISRIFSMTLMLSPRSY